MTVHHIKFLGAAALAVKVATAIADADGVELVSSEPPSILGENRVELAVAVEGTTAAVEDAVASIRDGIPSDASIEIVRG